MVLEGDFEAPLATLDEARAIAWSDAVLFGIHWSADRNDLLVDLQLGSVNTRLGTDRITMRAAWAYGLDIDMHWGVVAGMRHGGPAMTIDVAFAYEADNKWTVEFDFGAEGTIRFRCSQLFVRRQEPS